MRERDHRSNQQQSQQRGDDPSMPAPERPDHRQPAFDRCGLRSTGAWAPVSQRHASMGHNVATPGRSNSLKVLGAAATPGSILATARDKNSAAKTTPISAYHLNSATIIRATSTDTA